jgi:hypothetical protein
MRRLCCDECAPALCRPWRKLRECASAPRPTCRQQYLDIGIQRAGRPPARWMPMSRHCPTRQPEWRPGNIFHKCAKHIRHVWSATMCLRLSVSALARKPLLSATTVSSAASPLPHLVTVSTAASWAPCAPSTQVRTKPAVPSQIRGPGPALAIKLRSHDDTRVLASASLSSALDRDRLRLQVGLSVSPLGLAT